MQLNAVAVTTSNLKNTVKFYELLGFEFPIHNSDEGHLEAINNKGSARLMIDTVAMIKNILDENPKPGNHSMFAIEYENSDEIDKVAQTIKANGFKIVKEPWDAFWGQRYAIVEDPDGYKIDLYVNLPK